MIRSLLFWFAAFASSTQAFVGLHHARCAHSLKSPTSSAINSVVVRHQRHHPSALFADSSDGATDREQEGLSSLATPLHRPVLALVDAAALTGFAAVGKASHGADGALDVLAVLSTALPFLLAWFATSPLTGVYQDTDKSRSLVTANARQVVPGWAVAVPLGCLLRGVLKGYVPPVSFVVVTLIATLVILVLARISFAVVEDFFVEFV